MPFDVQIKWSSQDTTVLQNYRRAYRLDTPSTFKNPLSHVVLGQGIGRFSPTMARPKQKRRVHKDQLALAVRKNFNALGVTEADVIVDWLYKTKHQGKQTPRSDWQKSRTESSPRQGISSAIRTATEMRSSRLAHTRTHAHAHAHTHTHIHTYTHMYTPRCTFGVLHRYPSLARMPTTTIHNKNGHWEGVLVY